MKAVFSVAGDGEFPQPSYDIGVMFNGLPGIVVLEVTQTTSAGYSGASEQPVTTLERKYNNVLRTQLKASEARAIASAILSAATEAKAE